MRARWGPSIDQPDTGGAVFRKAVQADMGVESSEGDEFSVRTTQPPLLCTGFEGSVKLGVVKELFDYRTGTTKGEEGETKDEESKEVTD